tara:strand:+ start:366 stop:569 length:204 start_codon:yes stop_codon:yes gene_type:complete
VGINGSDNDNNIYNLADEREKQRTLQRRKAKENKGAPKGQSKFWLYVQLLVFLLVIWILMKTCHFSG